MVQDVGDGDGALMKKLLLILAACAGVAGAAALAGNHLHGSAAVTAFPALIQGTGYVGPTAQPAQQGSPGDVGYNSDAIAQWDAPTLYSLPTATVPICVNAYHVNVPASRAFGQQSSLVTGIASVQISADGEQHWINATLTQAGYTAGIDEWCVSFNPANFTDGQHEFRAKVFPTSGIPRVLQNSFSATLTANSAVIPWTAHGQKRWKQLFVSGDPNFTAGFPYYLSPGGITPGGFMILDPSVLASGSPPAVPAITFTHGTSSPPYITFATALAAAPPAGEGIAFTAGVGTTMPSDGTTPMSVFNEYFICAYSTGLPANSYYLSNTYADAINVSGCTGLNAINSNGNSPLAAYPVINASAASAVTVTIPNSGSLEVGPTVSESLLLTTNANGHMNLAAKYVDGLGGTDPAAITRASCTSVAPCKTINAALDSAGPVGTTAQLYGGRSVTYAGGFTNAEFTYTPISGNSLQNGDAVTFTGTLPSQFTELSARTVSSGVRGTIVYYVAAYGGCGTNCFEVSTTPDGLNLVAGGGTATGIVVYQDVGGTIIYLKNSNASPNSNPVPYTLGSLTQSTTYFAEQTYVNIVPDTIDYPSLTSAATPISLIGNNNGLNVDKIHLKIDIVPETLTFTVTTPSASGVSPATFVIPSGTIPAEFNVTGPTKLFWVLDHSEANTNDCVATSYFSGASPYSNYMKGLSSSTTPSTITLVTSSGVNSAANFATCPGSMSLKFDAFFNMGVGYDIWYDGATATQSFVDAASNTGPGDTPLGEKVGSLGSTWYGAQFVTNATANTTMLGFNSATSVKGSTVTNYGGTAFSNSQQVLTSEGDTGAPNAIVPLTVAANATGAAYVDVTAASFNASNAAVGYILNNGAADGICNPGGYTNITGWDRSVASPNVRVYLQQQAGGTYSQPSTCTPANSPFNVGDGIHGDFIGLNANSPVNYILANNVMAASAYGEGIFITTNSAGTALDLAAVGNSLYLNATRPVAGFSGCAPISNMFVLNNYFTTQTLSATNTCRSARPISSSSATRSRLSHTAAPATRRSRRPGISTSPGTPARRGSSPIRTRSPPSAARPATPTPATRARARERTVTMRGRLCFLSHFVLCLAVAALAFFAWENGVPQTIFADDQSMATSVIGALFVGTALYLGRQAWRADETEAVSANFGHLAERLAVMCGFVGTAIGLSLQAKSLAGGATSFTALATSLFTTACGGVAAALIAIMTFNLEAGNSAGRGREASHATRRSPMRDRSSIWIGLADLLLCVVWVVIVAVAPTKAKTRRREGEGRISADDRVERRRRRRCRHLAEPAHGKPVFYGSRDVGCARLDSDNRGFMDELIDARGRIASQGRKRQGDDPAALRRAGPL